MRSIVHSTFFNADILTGLLFLAMGWIIRLFPPKSRKKIYGYRSFLSTRNQETWHEANDFAGKHSIRIAYVLLGIGVVIGLLFKSQDNWYYLFSVGAVIIAAMNLRGETEWHLSRLFEEDGRRKSHPGPDSRPNHLRSERGSAMPPK